MAYTQKPGRGNSSKTGSGLPTPFLQTPISEKAKKSVEDIGDKNKLKLAVESQAKSDSISAVKTSTNPNKYMKAREGNKAGNKTRKAGDVEPVQLFTNPNQYSTYQPRTGEKDTYFRGKTDNKTGKFSDKQVESDFKKVSLNKRTGEYDIK